MSDAKHFQDSLSAATEIRIYQGFPRKAPDHGIKEGEIDPRDIVEVGRFPFHASSILLPEAEELKAVLSKPSTLIPFSGQKRCGGFRPDFCVSWEQGAQAFNALVCFACHEVIFESGGREFRYDLEATAYEHLKEILSVYAVSGSRSRRFQRLNSTDRISSSKDRKSPATPVQ